MENGDFVIEIGQYKGKTIKEVHQDNPSYLRWLVSGKFCPLARYRALLAAVHRFLADQLELPVPAPAPSKPKVKKQAKTMASLGQLVNRKPITNAAILQLLKKAKPAVSAQPVVTACQPTNTDELLDLFNSTADAGRERIKARLIALQSV